MLLVGTSTARSQATPSHTRYDSNEFGTIVTTFSPAVTPTLRSAPAQRRSSLSSSL